MLFTHFIEKLVFQNYASNWSRIINIWYITVSKITNLQLTFNCKVCVRIFLRSIFFFFRYLYEKIHKSGKEVESETETAWIIITKLKLKLRSNDIFPRYMIEFMVECACSNYMLRRVSSISGTIIEHGLNILHVNFYL